MKDLNIRKATFIHGGSQYRYCGPRNVIFSKGEALEQAKWLLQFASEGEECELVICKRTRAVTEAMSV